MIRGWDPPFAYRTGYTPPRDIVARVPFSKPNPGATASAREQAAAAGPLRLRARSRAACAAAGRSCGIACTKFSAADSL